MISCEMNYNNVSADGKYIKLICNSVGKFDVFSGIYPTTNIAECAFKKMQLYHLEIIGLWIDLMVVGGTSY